jgi:hypothetical protein
MPLLVGELTMVMIVILKVTLLFPSQVKNILRLVFFQGTDYSAPLLVFFVNDKNSTDLNFSHFFVHWV